MRQLTLALSGQCSRFKMGDLCGSSATRGQHMSTHWCYTMKRAAALPGGQGQHAGGYGSYRYMSGCGANTQIHVLVAIAGHAADWNAGS